MADPLLRKDDEDAGNGGASHIASALRTLGTEEAGIAALSAAMRDGLGRSFVRAVELIATALASAPGQTSRVIVSGMGKSGHVGRKIAATLASTGTPAFFVHPSEAGHGDLGMIANSDVILALSWSGETAELRNLIAHSRRHRIGLISMTSRAASTLGAASDVVLELPDVPEACPHNLAPTTSSLIQLALGDALAIALLERRGFTALNFRDLHPGGRLGAALQFVRDVMHKGEAIPLCRTGTPMSEAIIEMTAKGFGCVGIVDGDGRLAGIVTDGDLRRHMGPGLLGTGVDRIMTRGPKTVRGDQLVGEALQILNAAKITAVLVVDGGKPVGIVHLHDLLRAGIA